jgi:quinol monooxygenase YgiN
VFKKEAIIKGKTMRSKKLLLATACTIIFFTGTFAQTDASKGKTKSMHGLIGKMIAVEGKRDALIDILITGTRDMPGCLSYVVAKDTSDNNAIWITEVWIDEASHKASLKLPMVQEAIKKGRPLIAKFDQSNTTIPVGGHGIK